MRKTLVAVLVGTALLFALSVSSGWAGQIAGKIQEVNHSERHFVLERSAPPRQVLDGEHGHARRGSLDARFRGDGRLPARDAAGQLEQRAQEQSGSREAQHARLAT